MQWDKWVLSPVYETIGLVKKELDQKKALIGFAGSPWTVACYMIDGHGGAFPKSQQWADTCKMDLEALLDVLIDATTRYLKKQIEAGVDAVQLFDSHAGLLSDADFERFVIKPTRIICSALKKDYPNLPIIGFPRNANNADYEKYAKQTGVQCVGVDHSVECCFMEKLQSIVPCVQGNLDPTLLLEGGAQMEKSARAIIRQLPYGHIFNLGHGVIKETPPEHIVELIKVIREQDEKE